MWFNAAFLLYLLSQYKDNKKNLDIFFPNFEFISAGKIESLKEICEEIRVSLKWHRKDVALIDNRTVQHSKDKILLRQEAFLFLYSMTYLKPPFRDRHSFE